MELLKCNTASGAPAQTARVGMPSRVSSRPTKPHHETATISANRLEWHSSSSLPVRIGRREALRSVLLTGIATGMVTFLAPPPPPSSAKVSIASVIKGEEGERDIQMTARQVATAGSQGLHGGPGARGTGA